MQTFLKLSEMDWSLFTETLAHTMLGWPKGKAAQQYAELMRQSVTQAAFNASLRAMADMDVAPLLPTLRVPTLVLHRRDLPMTGVDSARFLAAQIPTARLAVLDGKGGAYALENWQEVLDNVEEFLGEDEAKVAPAAAAPGLVTILFTDIEGSTALTQRLGDARAQEVLRIHNTIVRDALKAHSGSETKHTGDGIMASFASASRALECAIDIQRGFAQHSESNPDMPVRVRIGLNAGEPVAEEEDLFGTAVQLAARVCAHAEPGQVLLPEGVRHLVAGKRFLFADIGEIALRGFEDPVRLFEVRWREEG